VLKPARSNVAKVFCFFFSKKKRLLSSFAEFFYSAAHLLKLSGAYCAYCVFDVPKSMTGGLNGRASEGFADRYAGYQV
jgi:hypothetical protein